MTVKNSFVRLSAAGLRRWIDGERRREKTPELPERARFKVLGKSRSVRRMAVKESEVLQLGADVNKLPAQCAAKLTRSLLGVRFDTALFRPDLKRLEAVENQLLRRPNVSRAGHKRIFIQPEEGARGTFCPGSGHRPLDGDPQPKQLAEELGDCGKERPGHRGHQLPVAHQPDDQQQRAGQNERGLQETMDAFGRGAGNPAWLP